MFGILHYDHAWMVSRRARRRFIVLTIPSLLLGGILLLMRYQPKLIRANQQPAALRIVETIVALPSIVGGLCMFAGMGWYCLELDSSKKFVRLLRAFLMLITFPWGQIVYYFLIYRPQTERVEMRII